MNTTQEPKYKIVGDNLVNRQSGEHIPEDEPLFILRGRDVHAATVLEGYLSLCKEPAHIEAVRRRLNQFQRWNYDHPDRMKEPTRS